MQTIDTIVWDWNGTLLNDVDLCVDSINRLLSQRGLGLLTRSAYREIFTFPVRDYYLRAGFDFDTEPWDEVAFQFIDLYRKGLAGVSLHVDAKDILEMLARNGFRQYLISAMEHGFLMESMKNCGVDRYFEDYSGIRDHFADGKVAMARKFVDDRGIDPAKAVFIGDTLHDHEVAVELGMHSLLVANGHQSEDRLLGAGGRVARDLAEAVDMIRPHAPELKEQGQ